MTKIEKEILQLEIKEKSPLMLEILNYLFPENRTFGVVFANPKKSNLALWIGEFTEKKKRIVSGVFNDKGAVLKSVFNLDSVVFPEGTFVSLNELDPKNRTNINERLYANDLMIDDKEIRRLSNIFVNVNPVRPVNLSSTDEEKENALRIANSIKNDMVISGWPEPLVADIGNGVGLVYKIDLLNAQEGLRLIETGFEVVCEGYSSDEVDVSVVYSPCSQIPLLGTWVREGEDLPNRPHRLSSLISVPSEPKPISQEQLESLIKPAANPSTETAITTSEGQTASDEEELPEIAAHFQPEGKTLSGEDIIRMEIPIESPVIIENMIVQREITSLYSSQDNGKSVLALNIALAVGSPIAESVFGFRIINHCNCLFVNTQSLVQDIKNRIFLMCTNNVALQMGIDKIHYLASLDDDIRLSEPNLLIPEFVNLIIENAIATQSKVIIYDNVADIINAESSVSIRKSLNRIKSICDKTNTAAVLVHSENMNTSSKVGNEIYQTSDNSFTIGLSKNFNGCLTLRCDKSRHNAKPGAVDIEMNSQLTFERVAPLVSSGKPGNKQVNRSIVDTNMITSTLNDLGGVVSKQMTLIEAVAELTGASQSKIRNTITEAVDLGLIVESQNPNSKRDKIYQVA